MGIEPAGNKILWILHHGSGNRSSRLECRGVQHRAATSNPLHAHWKEGRRGHFFMPCNGIWLRVVQLKVAMNSTEVKTHADPGLDHSSKQLPSSSLVWNQQWQITALWTHSSGLQISGQQQSWCACAPEPSGRNEEGVGLISQGDPSQQL